MNKLLGISLAAVILAACTSTRPPEKQPALTEAPQLAGTSWVAEFIDRQGVADHAQSTLEFPAANRVAGRGGCNQYGGAAVLSGNTVRFGPLMATKMACAPPLMDQEDRFLKALESAGTFRMDDDGKLVLVDESGAERLKLSRRD